MSKGFREARKGYRKEGKKTSSDSPLYTADIILNKIKGKSVENLSDEEKGQLLGVAKKLLKSGSGPHHDLSYTAKAIELYEAAGYEKRPFVRKAVADAYFHDIHQRSTPSNSSHSENRDEIEGYLEKNARAELLRHKYEFNQGAKRATGMRKNLEGKLPIIGLSFAGLFGIFFLSANITGNVIFGLSQGTSNLVGGVIFFLVILGIIYFFKKK
jgi:hypothetical protein